MVPLCARIVSFEDAGVQSFKQGYQSVMFAAVKMGLIGGELVLFDAGVQGNLSAPGVILTSASN